MSFIFGSDNPRIDGQSAATVVESSVSMSVAATIPGALLTEEDDRGAGSTSRGVAGATDPQTDRFNVLGGTLAGQSEGMTFSFDTAGVITELFFDGLSDEAFEFFRLETPDGQVFSIFDSEVPDRLLDLASLDEPNPTFLSETGGADDDIVGLSIPFSAGGVFTLTYGEYLPELDEIQTSPGFTEPNTGNGGRFQGVTIVVPEPAAGLLAGLAAWGLSAACRTCGSFRR